jgi:ABC-type transport system involved in multi-copper enzyme maturation permease subunit
MKRLIEIELIKLKNSKASKVLISIYFLLLTSITLIAAIKFDIGPIKFHLAEQGIFNFPLIWHFNTFIASVFKFFLLLVIVSMVTNEYSNRTLKQNLIDGLSKKEFILSKFYLVVILSLISTLFIFVVSLILGYFYSDYNELSIVFSDLEYLLAFFVKLVGFFSFGLFLGMLIKRSAFAIGAMFVWLFGEGIIYGFLQYKFGHESDFVSNVMQFLPLTSMSNLIKQPFGRLKAIKSVANQVGEQLSTDYGVHWYQIAIVLVWTGIFIYLSYKLLLKRDL